MQILERLKLLEEENMQFRKENQALREQLRLLMQQLERSGVKKDSHNNLNSPSQDKSRLPRTKSRRRLEDRLNCLLARPIVKDRYPQTTKFQ